MKQHKFNLSNSLFLSERTKNALRYANINNKKELIKWYKSQDGDLNKIDGIGVTGIEEIKKHISAPRSRYNNKNFPFFFTPLYSYLDIENHARAYVGIVNNSLIKLNFYFDDNGKEETYCHVKETLGYFTELKKI